MHYAHDHPNMAGLAAMHGAKEIIKKKWIAEDPILRDLRILQMAANTNYLVSIVSEDIESV